MGPEGLQCLGRVRGFRVDPELFEMWRGRELEDFGVTEGLEWGWGCQSIPRGS